MNMKLVTILINIFSAGAIIFAWYVEHILKVLPCELCVYQRVIYYLLFAISLLNLLLLSKSNFIKGFQYIYILLFTASFTVAVYHVAVERSIIEHTSCNSSLSISKLTNLAAIKEQILNGSNKIACKVVAYRILGLSMSEINAIFAMIVLIFIMCYKRARSINNH